ncbi:MAG: hypothetical protein DRI84_04375 [Bacteroidetes bacterium]|nr:MAG: hypothetical protein DRI84_04375 [Bacteroidota bacterium]
MNTVATISLYDYILEIGNHFFKINDEDYTNSHDDLTYESTQTDGINGYALRIEEKADGFLSYIILVFDWINSLFRREKKIETPLNFHSSKYEERVNTQIMIHNKVRSRLLDIINEDVDKWHTHSHKPESQSRNSHKNQFKMNRKECIDEIDTKKQVLSRLKHRFIRHPKVSKRPIEKNVFRKEVIVNSMESGQTSYFV